MKRIHQILTALVILLGVVHVAMTPVFFDEFAERVMWFVAQGLMGIVVGFLNIAAARAAWRDPVTTRLCHLANGLSLVFIGLYTVVDRALPSWVGIGLFVLLTISALVLDRQAGQGRQRP